MIQENKAIHMRDRGFGPEFDLLGAGLAPYNGTSPGTLKADYPVLDPVDLLTVHLGLLVKNLAHEFKTFAHFLFNLYLPAPGFIQQGLKLLDIAPQILQKRFPGAPDQLPAPVLFFAESQ